MAHLIGSVNAEHVLYSSEPSVAKAIETAREIVQKKSGGRLVAIPMPIFEDIFNGTMPRLEVHKGDPASIALYTHSSGNLS
jgi:hypothetical protein